MPANGPVITEDEGVLLLFPQSQHCAFPGTGRTGKQNAAVRDSDAAPVQKATGRDGQSLDDQQLKSRSAEWIERLLKIFGKLNFCLRISLKEAESMLTLAHLAEYSEYFFTITAIQRPDGRACKNGIMAGKRFLANPNCNPGILRVSGFKRQVGTGDAYARFGNGVLDGNGGFSD
jgi:hypothetical protein